MSDPPAPGWPARQTTVWRVEDSAGMAGSLPYPPKLEGDLPDINVWLALVVQEHPHHAAARAYWSASDPQLGPSKRWFCRVTMLGLVRLLCQPKVVGEGALTLQAAHALYTSLLATPDVAMLAEPAQAGAHLAALLAPAPLPPRLWTYAWLAATARAAGLRLVSFDRDFERFALPKCLVLAREGF